MVNVHFPTIGAFMLIATGYDKKLEYTHEHCPLDDMFERAQNLLEKDGFCTVDILDARTGEVIATITTDENDEDDDDCRCYNPYEEMGFNPYLGDYDYDC